LWGLPVVLSVKIGEASKNGLRLLNSVNRGEKATAAALQQLITTNKLRQPD